MAITHLTKEGLGGQPQSLIDGRRGVVYVALMALRSFFQTVGLAIFLGVLFSCSSGAPELMPKQTLFHLQLGTLEDQMDLFLRHGLPTPEENHFIYYHGLFLIANGNSRKVMELTSYGDLVTLFYNPSDNPQPVLSGSATEPNQVLDRRAFAYPFRHVGVLNADSKDRLYVEDRVPAERIAFDPTLKVRLESVVLRFSKNGKLLDYLGQEGVGGTPFPPIDKIQISQSDEVSVICRVGIGWEIWWFSSSGVLTARVSLPFGSVPNLAQDPLAFSDIQSLWADPSKRLLWIQVNFYKKLEDPTTKTDSGIKLVQSRIFSYDPLKSQFSEGFALPILAREKDKASNETVEGDRPLQFLGLSGAGLLFFLSSPENGGERLLVLNQQGKLILERTIAYNSQENTWLSDYQVTPQGVLVAMTCDGQQVELAWWRSDKLLSSYAPVTF